MGLAGLKRIHSGPKKSLINAQIGNSSESLRLTRKTERTSAGIFGLAFLGWRYPSQTMLSCVVQYDDRLKTANPAAW